LYTQNAHKQQWNVNSVVQIPRFWARSAVISLSLKFTFSSLPFALPFPYFTQFFALSSFFSFRILDISLLIKKQQMRNANVEKKKKKEKETNTKTQILEIVSGRVQRAATSEALCVRQISFFTTQNFHFTVADAVICRLAIHWKRHDL